MYRCCACDAPAQQGCEHTHPEQSGVPSSSEQKEEKINIASGEDANMEVVCLCS